MDALKILTIGNSFTDDGMMYLPELLEAAGIRKKGGVGWLKSFAEPVAVVLPINILELFIRPISLCMRLFG